MSPQSEILDHHELQWCAATNLRDGLPKLQHYKFEMFHHPGASNGNADKTSRFFMLISHHQLSNGCKWDPVYDLQRRYPDLKHPITYFQFHEPPQSKRVVARILLPLGISTLMTMEFDIIFSMLVNDRLVISFANWFSPSFLPHKIPANAHDDNNREIKKPYEKLRNEYYWFGCSKMSHIGADCGDCIITLSPTFPCPRTVFRHKFRISLHCSLLQSLHQLT